MGARATDEHEVGRAGAGERAARLALLLLILALPAVYVPRLFGGAPASPLPGRPTWAHVVLLTAGTWPASDAAFFPARTPALAALESHATRIERFYAPSADRAACAASLWTGRWPAHHGVMESSQALAPGTWTLAAAAMESGAATAAFLQEPFVTATGIEGFERTLELPELRPDAAGERAADFLRAHPDRRALVWIHLREAGAGGAGVEAALGPVQAALEETGRAFDTATLVLGLGSAAPGERAFLAPDWFVLPAHLYSGRRSDGMMSLVDVAGTLRALLRLAPPDSSRGQVPLQSRLHSLGFALRGGGGADSVAMHWSEGLLWRTETVRIRAETFPPNAPSQLVVEVAERPGALDAFLPSTLDEHAGAYALFRRFLRDCEARRTEPRAAHVPAAWRGRDGW